MSNNPSRDQKPSKLKKNPSTVECSSINPPPPPPLVNEKLDPSLKPPYIDWGSALSDHYIDWGI